MMLTEQHFVGVAIPLIHSSSCDNLHVIYYDHFPTCVYKLFSKGVFIRWNGTVEWNGGMDYNSNIMENSLYTFCDIGNWS